MKILVSAFSFCPHRGSEPGVGWNWSKLMTDLGHEVTVVTTDEFKQIIENEQKQNPNPLMRVVFVDLPASVKKKTVYAWNYYFQRVSYEILKKLVKNEDFDCAWFLTMGNAFLPTRVYKLNVPYIYGPIAAGERVYPAIYRTWAFKDRLPHAVKNLLVKVFWAIPNVRRNAKKASVILARTPDTMALFPSKIQKKCVLAPETFFLKEDIVAIERYLRLKQTRDFVFFYDGRLIPLKGLDIAIKAYKEARPKMPNAKFVIVGDGPDESRLMSLSKEEPSIVFMGRMPREKTLELLGQADCFLFPSLKEGCAWSLAEAMSLQKPIICIDGNGVGMLTSDTCAVRVHVGKESCPSNLVRDFERSIMTVYEMEAKEREKLGARGRGRILSNFSVQSAAAVITTALNGLDK